jgi:hypothetical protein
MIIVLLEAGVKLPKVCTSLTEFLRVANCLRIPLRAIFNHSIGALGGSATPKPTIGTKSSFTVLGKGLSKKKKEVQEDPVDDWEQAVDNE